MDFWLPHRDDSAQHKSQHTQRVKGRDPAGAPFVSF